MRRQVEAYEADPSAGASKGHSSIQIRRDWKAKEKQLQVTNSCILQANGMLATLFAAHSLCNFVAMAAFHVACLI